METYIIVFRLRSSSFEGDFASSSEESPVEYLEDTQITSLSIEYCGDEIQLSEARAVLGLTSHPPQDVLFLVRSFSNEPNGLLSNLTYQKGMMKLIGVKYVSLSVLQRSVSDFILDRLFSIFDPTNSGFCSSRDICCALTLFCGGRATERARATYHIQTPFNGTKNYSNGNRNGHSNSSNSDSDSYKNGESGHLEGVHLLTAVQCISALLKAFSALDPSVKVYDLAYADHIAVRTTLQYVFSLSDHSLKARIEESQLFPMDDFIRLFSSVLQELELEKGEKKEEQFKLKLHSPIRKIKKGHVTFEFPEMNEGNKNKYDTRNVFLDDSEDDYSENSDDEDDNEDENKSYNTSDVQYFVDKSRSLPLNVDTSLGDDDDGNEPVGDNESIAGSDSAERPIYLDDEVFPPSATILELRGARSILGLENYKVCTMLETLAEKSEEGLLKLDSWMRFLRITKMILEDL